MTIRDDLHQLIDKLDDASADELLKYARWLAADEDDEPLTEEELQQVEQSRAELSRGEYVTLEELRNKLAL